MPSRDWQFRIKDMMQASLAIQNRVVNLSFADFQENDTIAKSIFFLDYKPNYECFKINTRSL